MSKEEWLNKILIGFAESARIASEAQKLGQSYTDEYSVYKKGQKLFISEYTGHKQLVIINTVTFDEHSKINGLARLYCTPIKKDGTKILRRHAVRITEPKQILGFVD